MTSKDNFTESLELLDTFIAHFNSNKVDYMIVGGTAVNIYGYHRLSSNLPEGIIYDFDIWYKPKIENFNR